MRPSLYDTSTESKGLKEIIEEAKKHLKDHCKTYRYRIAYHEERVKIRLIYSKGKSAKRTEKQIPINREWELFEKNPKKAGKYLAKKLQPIIVSIIGVDDPSALPNLDEKQLLGKRKRGELQK